MGKQKIILTQIVKCFVKINESIDFQLIKFEKKKINFLFKKSLNKSDLVRKILNEVVLSNDEIIQLLRICFKKRNEL